MNSAVPARIVVVVLLCCALWVAYAQGQPLGQDPASLNLVKLADGLVRVPDGAPVGDAPPHAALLADEPSPGGSCVSANGP